MIRMIKEEDIFSCWWWYNWYITHATFTLRNEPISNQEFTEMVHSLRESKPWLVYEDDGDLMGYAHAVEAKDPWQASISIFVRQDHLKEGYGRALLKELMSLLKEDGYRKVVGLVPKGNDYAEGLFRSFRFEEIELEETHTRNGVEIPILQFSKEIIENKERTELPENHNPYAQTKRKRVPIGH